MHYIYLYNLYTDKLNPQNAFRDSALNASGGTFYPRLQAICTRCTPQKYLERESGSRKIEAANFSFSIQYSTWFQLYFLVIWDRFSRIYRKSFSTFSESVTRLNFRISRASFWVKYYTDIYFLSHIKSWGYNADKEDGTRDKVFRRFMCGSSPNFANMKKICANFLSSLKKNRIKKLGPIFPIFFSHNLYKSLNFILRDTKRR